MKLTRRSLLPFLGAGALALLSFTAALAAPPPLPHRTRPHVAKAHAKVTAAQANVVALKEFFGRVVGKTKLENENGKWQYSVMVRSGKRLREVMVDANTGRIASVEVTRPAAERREAGAETTTAKNARHHSGRRKPAKALAHRGGTRIRPSQTK